MALHGGKLMFANTSLNFLAAATANSVNCFMVRHRELKDGILLRNKTGSVSYGRSKIAGRQAVHRTAFGRFCIIGPMLFIPMLGNNLLFRYGMMPKSNLPSRIIQLSLCGMSTFLALSMTTAVYK